MKTLSEYLQIPSHYKDSRNVSIEERKIGYEAEREGVNTVHYDMPYYKIDIAIKEDGSLRDRGAEFVFIRPLNLSQAKYSVMQLFQLWSANGVPTHSTRTSDHIHIDIGDFTLEQMVCLYTNSRYLEYWLFSLGEKNGFRINNNFCIPHDEFYKNDPFHLYRGFKVFVTTSKYMSFRFSGLLGSMGTGTPAGTIEYRIFESSDSPLEVIKWIKLLLEIVDRSKAGFTLPINPTRLDIKRFLPENGKYLSIFTPKRRSKHEVVFLESDVIPPSYYKSQAHTGRFSKSIANFYKGYTDVRPIRNYQEI